MKKFSLLLAILAATAAIMANFRNSRDLPPVYSVAPQNIQAKRNCLPWHSEGYPELVVFEDGAFELGLMR